MIGNEHLVAVQLNFVTLHVDVVFDFWEIQNTGEIERIIHVEVDVEQRIFAHGEQLAVEVAVIFLFQVGWLFGPCRSRVVDDVVGLGFYLFAVFPFFFLAKSNFYG